LRAVERCIFPTPGRSGSSPPLQGCRGDWTSVGHPFGHSGGSDARPRPRGSGLVAACLAGHATVASAACRCQPAAPVVTHAQLGVALRMSGGWLKPRRLWKVKPSDLRRPKASKVLDGACASSRRLFAPGRPFAGVPGLTGRLTRSRPAAPILLASSASRSLWLPVVRSR